MNAWKGYRYASTAAKALRAAHMAALGVAAVSLVVGGVRVAKSFRGEQGRM